MIQFGSRFATHKTINNILQWSFEEVPSQRISLLQDPFLVLSVELTKKTVQKIYRHNQ